MKTTLATCIAVLVPAWCGAQPPDGGDAAASMVRAAGMPLQVSDVAPGTLIVRLVRGAFVEDLAGETVRIEVAGSRVQFRSTGADGRAQFVLPVGSQVRARATVDGEELESEFFAMPASGGVRVLLVAGSAGDGGGTGVSAALPAGHPPIDDAAAAVAAPPPVAAADHRVAAGILGGITLAVFVAMVARGRYRRQASAGNRA